MLFGGDYGYDLWDRAAWRGLAVASGRGARIQPKWDCLGTRRNWVLSVFTFVSRRPEILFDRMQSGGS